jgi:ribosomal protein S18 acetylase RimI-like enzyme
VSRPLVIRAASPADVAAIADVCARAMRLAYGRLASQGFVERAITHWFAPDRLRRDLAAAGDWFGYDVATVADTVVGVAGSGLVEAGHGELYTLYVDPASQRTGVGRALVCHTIARAVRAGVSRLDVAVLPGNLPAMRFYEACGFSFAEERPIYAPHGQEGGPEVALVYRRQL